MKTKSHILSRLLAAVLAVVLLGGAVPALAQQESMVPEVHVDPEIITDPYKLKKVNEELDPLEKVKFEAWAYPVKYTENVVWINKNLYAAYISHPKVPEPCHPKVPEPCPSPVVPGPATGSEGDGGDGGDVPHVTLQGCDGAWAAPMNADGTTDGQEPPQPDWVDISDFVKKYVSVVAEGHVNIVKHTPWYAQTVATYSFEDLVKGRVAIPLSLFDREQDTPVTVDIEEYITITIDAEKLPDGWEVDFPEELKERFDYVSSQGGVLRGSLYESLYMYKENEDTLRVGRVDTVTLVPGSDAIVEMGNTFNLTEGPRSTSGGCEPTAPEPEPHVEPQEP